MKNTLATIAFLFIALGNLYAHNMWIETSGTGKLGKEQSVKVYLGGYGENERDSTSKWFGNTKEFTLWITEPNGTKKQLTTKAAAICFEATFTPDKEGVYTVSLSHELAELFGTTKYVYYSVSQVRVGASTAGQNNVTINDLNIQVANAVAKKPVAVTVQYKGKNAENTWASVGAPTGWAKALDAKTGTGTFDALWEGLYVVEASYKEKAEGTLAGKEYKTISHTATFGVTVNK